MVAGLPDTLNVLVTRKLRTVAAPMIAALRADVIISAAFPRLIPAEILEIPAYGAINCHPSPLPAGRGPTPQRLIYEGDERVGATVHRTAAEFDTGAILAQRIAPLPDDLNGSGLMQSWRTLLSACLDEAVPKLVALNVTAPTAQLELDGTTHLITRTDPATIHSTAPPGTVLEKHPNGWTIQTADLPLRLTHG
ncbi:formyltransferase family protein [Kribbella sindirgiensis]|uniref:Formyl transferase N-terminal domain-containing protein n=1 Tax=Kribbella sindirgiensis TaxID=1124744 RepID=A0A4R0IT63_9ACTN|nr:formyltransferase family protein [Kribbella sindirgiensis]TCC37051.1 hypothetical protein E0H50_10250 [Kribbella sindirgiensis]